MPRTTRWMLAGAAMVFAAMAACPSSSADEAPPKADAPKPLRLRLEAGKTYLYRFSESVIDRMKVEAPQDRDLRLESRCEVVWDAGLTLQSVEANGDVIVSLLPTRVRGSAQRIHAKPVAFDSDDPATAVTSPFLGRGIRVRLSSEGRVLDAEFPALAISAVPADPASELAKALARLGPAPPGAFVQMFVQQLPSEAPRAGRSWTATRALPLRWRFDDGKLRCTAFAEASEKVTVESAGPDSVSATLVARGKREVPKVKEPVNLGGDPSKALAALGEQVEEWFVTGDVRVRRDTGLVELRTTTCTLATHVNAVRLPKDVRAPQRGLPGDVEATSGSDHTYEITTRLELVDVR